jgi:hypothetical protein
LLSTTAVSSTTVVFSTTVSFLSSSFSIITSSVLLIGKWFMAIYLFSSHKKGISSLQLHRDLDITQKTLVYVE